MPALPSNEIVEVVAALVREGGRFLICQRPADKKRALLWEFPGGKMEPGESLEAALRRECQEELDVCLDVGPLYTSVLHRYPDIHIRLSLYEARIASGALTLKEHAAIRWITAAEIDNYPFCPADKDILAALKADAGL